MEKLILKDFVKQETDWLWSLINDKEWREEMWQSSYHKGVYKAKDDWRIKDMIHDKKALREVAKHMSIELKQV
jgi:hypothetical protein